MSSSAARASKLNDTAPSFGSTVIVGFRRRPAKTFSRSFAFHSRVARSSWMVLASFAANWSLVGVLIRSTWATRMPCLISSWATRHTSEDLP